METEEKCKNCGHKLSEHETEPPAPSGRSAGDDYEYPGSCEIPDCACFVFRGE